MKQLIDVQRLMVVESALKEALESLGVVIDECTTPEVVLLAQRNPAWKDYEYAPGFTIGAKGCLITCCTMIIAAAGYDVTPVDVAKELARVGCFVGGDLIHPELIPEAYPKMRWVQRIDWRNRKLTPYDLASLEGLLEGGPVILEVEGKPGGAQPPTDQHFVIALRFIAGNSDLEIVDPWDGTYTHLLERYALAHWDLARAIYGARVLRVSR